MSAVPHIHRHVVTKNRGPWRGVDGPAANDGRKAADINHRQLAAVAALLRKKGLITQR